MKKASLLSFPALMLFAGCQLDSIDSDGGRGVAPVDPKTTGWEALPTGKSFLQDGTDSNGVPIYVPVKFQDSSALVHGDIAIATGAAQLAELRAKLVDPEEHQPAALGKSSGVVKTSTITGGANAWPGGFIPYVVGGGVDKKLVEEAVYEFNQSFGISYIPWQSKHTAYVVFVPTAGPTSFSAVGMVANAPQTINIVPGHGRSVMIHEMCHAAGMYHEQMRSDRDNFVTITTSGVDDGGWWNANWGKVADGTNVGDYDKLSIMHYGAGTSTYTRKNGLLYKVTMTSKTGGTLGGSTPTATDKLSLWHLSANAFPFHVQAVKTQLAGKVTKLYTTYSGGVTRKFIVIYDPATGNANVNAVNADNTYGNSVQNYNVGAGYNLITPYVSATGQHILFYSSTTGAVKMFNLIAAGGAISPGAIATSTWATGWSSIDHYEAAYNKHYWYFQNRANGVNHIWAVANNGTLGANTMSATWPGWNYAKPFYSETSAFVHSAFIVYRMTDGYTRIRRLNADGTLGSIVQDMQLLSYPAVGVYQSVTKAVLALAGPSHLFLVDMDHTGFSTRGTPWFRVAGGLPSAVSRMDAAADRFAMNASNSTINGKVYDMKHVITFEYQSVPGAVFSGWGAPFH